jgi:hypothetical protein
MEESTHSLLIEIHLMHFWPLYYACFHLWIIFKHVVGKITLQCSKKLIISQCQIRNVCRTFQGFLVTNDMPCKSFFF